MKKKSKSKGFSEINRLKSLTSEAPIKNQFDKINRQIDLEEEEYERKKRNAEKNILLKLSFDYEIQATLKQSERILSDSRHSEYGEWINEYEYRDDYNTSIIAYNKAIESVYEEFYYSVIETEGIGEQFDLSVSIKNLNINFEK